MLSKEDYAVIKSLSQRGVYLKDIAAELEVHPRTVKRALQRGGTPRAERKHKSSKLDAYKAKVDELLANDVWNVMVILREIQQLGYSGGQTILRDYVHPKRVLGASSATVRFETEPGQQLQSDWGEVASRPRIIPIFKTTHRADERRRIEPPAHRADSWRCEIPFG